MKRFLPLFLLPTFGVETHHLQTKETDPTKGSCDHESEPLDSSDSWSGWWSCSNLVGGWKIWVKLDHSPQGSGQNQKHLKPTIPEDGFFTKFELKSWNESLSWKGTETNSESHFCPFVPPCFFLGSLDPLHQVKVHHFAILHRRQLKFARCKEPSNVCMPKTLGPVMWIPIGILVTSIMDGSWDRRWDTTTCWLYILGDWFT